MNLESLSKQKEFSEEKIPDSSNPQYQNKPQAKQYSNGLERTFSFEDYDAIINHAELLRQVSEKKTSEKRWMEELAEPLRAGKVSESRVYEFANEMGIPREYVERAIQNRFPNNEEIIKQVRSVGGNYDVCDLVNAYKTHLLSVLENKYPGEKFEAKIINRSEFWDTKEKIEFYRVDEKIMKKKLFKYFGKTYFSKKIKKEKLATISYIEPSYMTSPRFHARLHLHSPLFLNACLDTLKKLNEFISLRLIHTEKDYPLDVQL